MAESSLAHALFREHDLLVTPDAPTATLEAARNAIRALKEREGLPKGGVTVWLRGGAYERASSFELTEQDSGSLEAPITYRAYPGETVRLLGGPIIKDFEPVRGEAILARLPEHVRPYVLQVDLRSHGIEQPGALTSRGFGRPIQPAHSELFFGDEPMALASWPKGEGKEGNWMAIAALPAGTGHNDDHGGTIGDLPDGFHYDGDRPRQWQTLDDVWVHGYWAWDWANSYEQIESVDFEQRLIKTKAPHGLYGFRAGQRFAFLNVLEELGRPGEYYIDRANATLYFWPPQNVESTEAIVSNLAEPIISLSNVSHVSFMDLTIEGTRGHGVRIEGGSSCTLAGCTICHTGNYAVWIEGGRNHSVASCHIYDNGDGGVNLSGGDRKTLEPGGHSVHNCHFHHQGRWSRCYVPAIHLHGVGLRARHNLIHDHPHCAILFWGNEHLIELNEVHHVCMETGDVGAIYTGRDWTARGNIIRHNFVYHTGGMGMGSMAVYLDDCASGTAVYGNVFYRVQRAAFVGGGRDNHIENNIFVECDPAVQIDGRGLDPQPVWHNMVHQTMRERLEEINPEQPPYSTRYPELAWLVDYYRDSENQPGVGPEGTRVVHNICVGKWLEIHWHATTDMVEVRDNLIDADPHFVDAANLNFQLRDDSPAYELGFEWIPFGEIGLLRTE